MILKATSFLEEHKSDTKETYSITHFCHMSVMLKTYKWLVTFYIYIYINFFFKKMKNFRRGQTFFKKIIDFRSLFFLFYFLKLINAFLSYFKILKLFLSFC
jgi:hypothetical protein